VMVTSSGPIQVASLIERGLLIINDGYRAKNSELGGHGLPFARAGNIAGGFNFDEADRFPQENLDRVGEKVSRPGDAVFTSKGTVGRFAFVTKHTPRFVYSPQLCFWRSLNTDVIDPRWLFYWMHSAEFFDQYSGVKGQTDMADYVSLGDQRRMVITLPPIEEQRATSDMLGSLDDKIDLNGQLNQLAEAMARAIFKAWFIDFQPAKAKASGATSFRGMPQEAFDQLSTEIVESELGSTPAGWEMSSIADIAEFVNGKAFTQHATSRGQMIIRIAELNSGPGSATKYSDIETEPEYTAFPDDILFAWSGSLGVHRWHRDNAIINQHIFKVIPKGRPKWYAYYRLVEAMSFFQAIASTKATTMGHIQRRHLSEAVFSEPPKWLIEVADTRIRPLYELIHTNERESIALAEIREALLPRIVSGKLRISGEAHG
jgi:type I restriction enzyme S subunit